MQFVYYLSDDEGEDKAEYRDSDFDFIDELYDPELDPLSKCDSSEDDIPNSKKDCLMTDEPVDENWKSCPEAFFTSLTPGYGVVDTACTNSIIGSELVPLYKAKMKQLTGMRPKRVKGELKTFRGFNVSQEGSTEILEWPVKIGQLQGKLRTYVVPGRVPLLLSKKMQAAMEAEAQVHTSELTSHKHGIVGRELPNEPNGHLMLNIFEFAGNEEPDNKIEFETGEAKATETIEESVPSNATSSHQEGEEAKQVASRTVSI